MVLPAVCLAVTMYVKQHRAGTPAVSPVAVLMVGSHTKKKTSAPTVDRAVTVGGFSASTLLPVGGPTAPATVWKSVQCQAFFIAACRDGFSIHPLRPQVKTQERGASLRSASGVHHHLRSRSTRLKQGPFPPMRLATTGCTLSSPSSVL
jgi:hypothetical protein